MPDDSRTDAAGLDRAEAQKRLALRFLSGLNLESKAQSRVILTEVTTSLNRLSTEEIQFELQRLEREPAPGDAMALTSQEPEEINEKVMRFLCSVDPAHVKIETRQIGILLNQPSAVVRGLTVALLHQHFGEEQVAQALRDASPGVREAAVEFLHTRLTLLQWIRVLTDTHFVVRMMAHQAAHRNLARVRESGVPDVLVERAGHRERHPNPASEIHEARA